MSPELMLRLRRKHGNIVGCKDTVVNFTHTRKLIDTILPEFPDFEIYSGYDDNFAHNVLSGGSGVIGGLTNIAPEVGSGWVKAFRENDTENFVLSKADGHIGTAFRIRVPFVPLVKGYDNARHTNRGCAHILFKSDRGTYRANKSILIMASLISE